MYKKDREDRELLKFYKIGEIIGTGVFGTAFHAIDKKTNKSIAIKKIKKTSKIEADIINKEVTIMKLCQHPHIIKLVKYFEDDQYYYIVMEYVNNGELYQYIIDKKRLDVNEAKIIFVQLLSAIEYLHGNLIAHRDIKAENILMDSKLSIKLIDFGLANYIRNDRHNTACGSLMYAAPEVLMEIPYNPMDADIWSMGVVLYTMVTGHFPWNDNASDDQQLIKETIIQFDYTPIIGDDLLADLINRIFKPSKERIKIRQIKEHPWLKNYVLPSYLPLKQAMTQIDCMFIAKLENLGFDPAICFMNVYKGNNTQETAIYYLLLEQKQNADRLEEKQNADKLEQINKKSERSFFRIGSIRKSRQTHSLEDIGKH